jgi:hypothetical protein
MARNGAFYGVLHGVRKNDCSQSRWANFQRFDLLDFNLSNLPIRADRQRECPQSVCRLAVVDGRLLLAEAVWKRVVVFNS